MFNNIFDKRKRFKQIYEKKPIIIADIHEKDSMIIPEIIEIGCEVKIIPLEIADYLIGDCAVERKTITDFIFSFYSKRLFLQLMQMQIYNDKILIIEGKGLENKIPPNVLKGLIISIITEFKTSILYSKDYKESANYLFALAKKQLKTKKDFSLHSRIPRTIKEQKHYILESFPKIGPKTAEKLILKYKSLKTIFNLNEQELSEILKSKSKDFIGLLNNPD